MSFFRVFGRIWFTGALCIFAAVGYCFYGVLYLFRLMQTRRTVQIAALAFLAAVGLGCGAAYWLLSGGTPGAGVEIVVAPGESVRGLFQELERRRVVRSSEAMALWARLKGVDRRIHAGRYKFRENQGITAAGATLLNPFPIDTSVTVPEGLTIEQTAEKLAPYFGFDPGDFTSQCRDTGFLSALGFAGTSLEGYLFPETYRFPTDATPRMIVGRMYREFERRYAQLGASDVTRGYTRPEIVTLASIVEKEATLASERPHIAGVFLNRLLMGWPLGADPTVRYAVRKFSGPLRVSELANPSPYNTRVHAGLPPGPICSPGLEALRAVVHPTETKDLYFVAKWDGTGAHDFSRSNAEHDRKKNAIRRLNDQRRYEARKGLR